MLFTSIFEIQIVLSFYTKLDYKVQYVTMNLTNAKLALEQSIWIN